MGGDHGKGGILMLMGCIVCNPEQKREAMEKYMDVGGNHDEMRKLWV